ncbi:MAG TPA: sugar ABC transporter substrate-binding protein, partial [Chloroflexota bacterium]
MEKTLLKFQQESGNKGSHVSYGGEPEYWAKVQAQHATKQVADVIWASVGGIYTLANRGVMAELDPVILGDKYNLEDYVKAGLDSLKLNGKLYGMPWGGHPGSAGILYNVDLLQKAGLNVTEDCASFDNLTWDQIRDAAKKATGGDTFGYLPLTDMQGMTNHVSSFGGEFLSPDGKQLTMDTPEFKKGLQYVADIFGADKSAPVFDPKLNSGELFATGKLAMVGTGYWGQFSPGPKAIADRFKWNVGVTPKGPAGKRGTALTINGQGIWSQTQKKDTAWQFVKYLMEPAQNVEVVLSGGGRPALRNSVLDNERLMKEMKAHKCFVPVIKAAEPWKQPANFRWAEFNSTIQQVFADLWLGKQTVDQAIADAKPKLQAILDKPVA